MAERVAPTMTPLPRTPADDGEPGLLDYARLLQGRWSLILAATVGCGAVALVVSWFTPRTYEASVTVAVRSVNGEQLPATAMAFARKLLENRSAAARVGGELGLDREPHGLSAERFVASHLKTELVRGSDLLQVYVRLDDPQVAARAANRFVQEVVAFNRRLNQQEAASAQGLLEAHVQQARERTERLEQEILSYKRNVQIEVSRQDAERALDQRKRLADLAVEIEAERAGLKRAEEELAKEDPATRVARGADALAYQVARSRMKLSALERERQELSGRRKGTGSRLAQLNALYDKEAGLSRLEAERDLASSIYSDLSRRNEQARIQTASRALELEVLDSATPPERASTPRTASNVATGAALGFVGCAFLLIKDLLTRAAISRTSRGTT